MPWYWILIIVVLVLILACFGVGFAIWYKAVPTPSPETYRNSPTDDPLEVELREFAEKTEIELRKLNMEEVWIKTRDGLNLHGYYREAPVKTNKVIISVHGWHGINALSSSALFTHFLVDYNYNLLFIDMRSYGESEGKYTGYGVKDSEDLLEWIGYIKDRFQNDVVIALDGISMGGFTVCATANKVPKEVKCIIDDCGYTSPWDEFHHCLKDIMHIPPFFLFFAEIVNLIVCHFDFHSLSSLKCLKASRVPVLFIHGAKDTFVPTAMGRKNFEACTSEKYIQIFDNAPHARSYFMNKEAYKKVVLDFLARKL